MDTLSAIFAERRRARFNVIHAFWVNEAGFLAMSAARTLETPMIASVAGGELVGLRQIGYGGQLDRVEQTMVHWVVKRANDWKLSARACKTSFYVNVQQSWEFRNA